MLNSLLKLLQIVILVTIPRNYYIHTWLILKMSKRRVSKECKHWNSSFVAWFNHYNWISTLTLIYNHFLLISGSISALSHKKILILLCLAIHLRQPDALSQSRAVKISLNKYAFFTFLNLGHDRQKLLLFLTDDDHIQPEASFANVGEKLTQSSPNSSQTSNNGSIH